jgi:hypothetical protein
MHAQMAFNEKAIGDHIAERAAERQHFANIPGLDVPREERWNISCARLTIREQVLKFTKHTSLHDKGDWTQIAPDLPDSGRAAPTGGAGRLKRNFPSRPLTPKAVASLTKQKPATPRAQRKFQCTQCTFHFRKMKDLQKHVKLAHVAPEDF